ncbi:MAG: amidohydrolase [Clostridia bacterium]|nr:amidohydrolase [Clostridia bacterium]
MNYPIIDCHCHIYPDKIADRAVRGIADFYDLAMYHDGRYSSLIESGNKIGVKHYVVFSVATTPHQVNSINTFIADTVKKSNGLLTGLGTLHPDSYEIEKDIEKIKELGLKGIKLHADFQKFCIDDPKCDRIYSLCEGVFPVLLHTGDIRYDFSNPDRVKNVLEKHKNLTVIGAHFGGWSCWKEAAEKLHDYENFYVDCCSTFNWLPPCEVRELIRLYGADKVVFGTDFPMWSHEEEYKAFKSMKLTQEEEEKILYKNAMKLFSIEKI